MGQWVENQYYAMPRKNLLHRLMKVVKSPYLGFLREKKPCCGLPMKVISINVWGLKGEPKNYPSKD